MQDYSAVALLALAAGLLALERFSPWRRAIAPVQYRWLTNISLFLLGGIVISLIFPTTVIDVALDMPDSGLRSLQLPIAAEVILIGLLLDFWRYWEHRLFHEVPLLWRAHLVHHSDTSLDVTTAERHHPLEAIVATCTALLLVFALGLSAQALTIYLIVAGLWSLLVHASIRLPEKLDRNLRRVFVTPAVHAVHHSALQAETNSNYGTLLTIWDRCFNTYVDPRYACIPNYGLEYFHQPEETALGPVLLQPFEYSPEIGRTPRTSEPTPAVATSTVSLPPAWRAALTQLGFGFALVLIALWPTSLSLASTWTLDANYQYAWLVIPMFIYLLGWYHRDRVLALTPQPDLAGLLVVLPALILWCAATVVDIQLLQDIAYIMLLQGLVLCILGRATYRSLLPVMAMLFLLIPSGDLLQPLLRSLTVKWVEWYAIAVQVPYSIEGFTAYIGDNRYVVVDACSGLAYVLMGAFLGYSFGLMIFRRFSRVLALAALGALLGVATNALRIWSILSVDLWRDTQMDVSAHEGLQWIALFVALAVLFYTLLKLSGATAINHTAAVACAAPAINKGRFAPLAASVLIVAGAGSVQLALQDSAGPTSNTLTELAERYPSSEWLHRDSPYVHFLSVPLNQDLEVLVVEPRSGQARVNDKLLGPQDKTVWRHSATANYSDCHDGHCIRFLHKTWRRKGEHPPRHSFYVYYAGELLTDSKFTHRLANGWNRLFGNRQSSGLISVERRGAMPASSELTRIVRQIRSPQRPNDHALALNANL